MNPRHRPSRLRRLWTARGRCTRTRFLATLTAGGALFVLAYAGMERTLGETSTLLLYPPLFWLAIAAACRRYHDLDHGGARLLLVFIPIFGPILVGAELTLKRGSRDVNRFGADPRAAARDYFEVQ